LKGKKCIVLARLIFTQFAAMKLLKGKKLDKINHLHKSVLNQRTKAIKKPIVPQCPMSQSTPVSPNKIGIFYYIIFKKAFILFDEIPEDSVELLINCVSNLLII
jgi:hypothetical protein